MAKAAQPRTSKAPKVRVKKAKPADRDFLYDNPPLVEVIVEIHWKISRLSSMPDGFLDPQFEEFSKKFWPKISSAGYAATEQLVPSNVPKEFFGHKVVERFRISQGAWPLFQIGPGVFTANIVPPYQGWRGFRSVVDVGLRALFDTYPQAKNLLELERLELRYIDGFTSDFGMNDPATFIKNSLGFELTLPNKVVAAARGGKKNVGHFGRIEMPLKSMKEAEGHISWNTGTHKSKQAIILELRARTTPQGTPQKKGEILSWLDSAHSVVSSWFEGLLSPEVKKLMGNKTYI